MLLYKMYEAKKTVEKQELKVVGGNNLISQSKPGFKISSFYTFCSIKQKQLFRSLK